MYVVPAPLHALGMQVALCNVMLEPCLCMFHRLSYMLQQELGHCRTLVGAAVPCTVHAHEKQTCITSSYSLIHTSACRDQLLARCMQQQSAASNQVCPQNSVYFTPSQSLQQVSGFTVLTQMLSTLRNYARSY